MADKSAASGAAKPVWMKQAEEAKVKIEAEKAAAAKAAFDATFKSADQSIVAADEQNPIPDSHNDSSDSDDDDEDDYLAKKPIGPVDPSTCAAQGAGIGGGAACTPCTFVVVTKDSDGRKLVTGGADVKVKISPAAGVNVHDQEGIVKDMFDGSYGVTYVVPQRGNYMVHVDCNGKPIMGSPFPVFFSAGSTAGGQLALPTASPYSNLVNQTMPNMPNYSGALATSGAAPSGVVSGASSSGWLGMMPGMVIGPSGGVILPGIGASLGEVCREFLNGKCSNSACKLNHPAQNLLATAVTAMGSMSQVPMAPAAAAIAAATAIRAAQQMQKDAQAKIELSDKVGKVDALKRTLQISNLNPLLTAEQLKQLFSYCGTVVDCIISDSKHFAYVEYSKTEEATAALAINNMDFGGRPLNVEMAKSLPTKPSPDSANLVMQQAIAMQQMQFQHALLMQQSMISQQAAKKAATMKSALEMASSRAAEISMKMKAEGLVSETTETQQKSSSPSPVRKRSKSRSKSPITRRSRRSRSLSFPRYRREHRSRSPARSRHYRTERVGSFRGSRANYSRGGDRYSREGRRECERSSDRHVRRGRSRSRSRSKSPKTRKSYRIDSQSPRRRRVSRSPAERKVSRAGSRSPTHYGSSRSSRRHERRSRSPYVLDRKGEAHTRGSGGATVRSHRRSRSKSADKKRSRSKSSERRHHSKKDRSRDRKRSRSEMLDVKRQADDIENEGKIDSEPKYRVSEIKSSGEKDAAEADSKARRSLRPRSVDEDGLPVDRGESGITKNHEKQYKIKSSADSFKEHDNYLGDSSHSDFSDDGTVRNTPRKRGLHAVTKSMEKSCNIREEVKTPSLSHQQYSASRTNGDGYPNESKTGPRRDANKHKKAACSDDVDDDRHYDAKSLSRDSTHNNGLSNLRQDTNMSDEFASP